MTDHAAFPGNPDSSTLLNEFYTDRNVADNYGTRVWGYVKPPNSGDYTFWISGDDQCELWLSTDSNSHHRVRIAEVPGWTLSKDWSKYPEQRSSTIALQADTLYFIEALQKEAGGGDSLGVAWTLPGASNPEVIPGTYLAPADFDPIDPPPPPPPGTNTVVYGHVTHETWLNVSGRRIDDLRAHPAFPTTPSTSRLIANFSTERDVGSDFGTRIHGYLRPDVSGLYSFWVAGDDACELWLSSDTASSNKVRIATVPDWTLFHDWYRFGEQQSAEIPLEAGQHYYIEALQKEAGGGDSLAVAWQVPGTSNLEVIPGPNLADASQPVGNGEGEPPPPPPGNTNLVFGSINYDRWLDIGGKKIADLTELAAYPNAPDETNRLTRFSSPVDTRHRFGARIHGYLRADHSGAHTFWIAGDDQCELWLSTDTDAANRIRIASVPEWTYAEEWDKYPQQQSVTVNLVAGQVYFIEALQKEDAGGDSLAVAWQTPSLARSVIPGANLAPQNLGTTPPPPPPPVNTNDFVYGEIIYDQWTDISGSKINDLVRDPDYPASPDARTTRTLFESERNQGTHFGARMHGYLRPDLNGDHTFWISGDDECELWLSSDEDPANRIRIAHVPDWNFYDEWDYYTQQQSVPISLVAGHHYFIEAIQKENTGTDHLTVAWQLPGTSSGPVIIPGTNLAIRRESEPPPPTNVVRVANTSLNFPTSFSSDDGYRLENALPGLNFNQPVAITSPPGEQARLFVVEKAGRVQVIPDTTNPNKQLFLDLTALDIDTQSESGLLGMAFHPNFANNRQFYLFYTLGHSGARHQRVSRFTASTTNPNVAEPGSEMVIWDHRDDSPDHNGGDIHFGPDGYLYIATGDEGYSGDFFNNGQFIDKNMWCGILRIDVDRKAGNILPNAHQAVGIDAAGDPQYLIPADNPWIGASSFNGEAVDPTQVRTEFYAVGLRNPWRMSFDSQSGELWVGDVGQDLWEEINVIRSGGNYGWSAREGTSIGPRPENAPANFLQDDPLYAYGRSEGRSITGGVVYRGSRYPALFGKYIFADYTSGRIWSLARTGDTVQIDQLASQGGIVGIGTDPANGDVLLATFSGTIWRLQPNGGGGSDTFPPTLSATGAFTDLDTLSPSPGIEPYAPNVPFWSDYAIKRRWFSIPDINDTMTFRENGGWDFPEGTVWIKHFELPLNRADTNSTVRVETRFLVKTENSVYGLSYKWNSAQSDATLVGDAGETVSYTLANNATQNWRIPGRQDCLQCHTDAGGLALSFNTRQLNRNGSMLNSSGNQIDLLELAGYFDNTLQSAASYPAFPKPGNPDISDEAHVRAYLGANCAMCHQPGGGAVPSFDARPELSLLQTGLIDGVPSNPGSNPANKLVAPGNPANSVLLQRMSACCGFSRMPPLGSNELDHENIALVNEWIVNETGSAANAIGGPEPRRSSPFEYSGNTAINLYMDGEETFFEFFRLRDFGYQMECSSDMINWRPWPDENTPINFSTYSGNDFIFGPTSNEPALFYRMRVQQP